MNEIKIGLSLSTGGAKAAAHFGLIRALEDANIKIDAIGGVSMGAAVAGLYALHPLTKELIGIGKEGVKKFYPYRSKKLNLNRNFLSEMLSFFYQDYDITQTKIPLVILAFNILKLRVEVFKEGSLKKAICSTCGVPPITPICKFKNSLYVDCGIFKKYPLKEMFDLGMDLVIVSDVGEFKSQLPKRNRVVYINTDLSGVGWLEFKKAVHCFKVGRETTNKALPRILEEIKKLQTSKGG